MKSIGCWNLLVLVPLGVSALCAQQAARVDLGRLQTGATVSFARSAAGEWGIEIAGAGAGAPQIRQPKPARLEVFRADDDIRQLAAGYKTVRKTAAGIDASAEIAYGENVVFHVNDRWSLSGAVVSVHRNVEVTGKAEGGFYSSVVLTVDPSVGWSDVNYMAPAALYGDPTYDGDRSPGGRLNYAARRLEMREDVLPAPLFALSFNNGASVAVLDPSPRGDTTVEETPAKSAMTDARFQFGALGARQADEGPIEFGFWFPGTTTGYGGGRGTPPVARTVRRYHPIAPGVAHSYEVRFRFGQNESFRDVTRDTWRWAWNTLNPAVYQIDVEQMRRVLTDHLAAQAATIDGRTAIPFVFSTMVDDTAMELVDGRHGLRGQEHRVRGRVVARRRPRQNRARTEDAPDRAGDYLFIDPGPSHRAARRDRLRPQDRKTVGAGARLARSLAAKRHRRHACSNARLPARTRPRAASIPNGSIGSSNMSTGSSNSRGRMDPSPGDGSVGATRSRRHRGRRATIPCRCSS